MIWSPAGVSDLRNRAVDPDSTYEIGSITALPQQQLWDVSFRVSLCNAFVFGTCMSRPNGACTKKKLHTVKPSCPRCIPADVRMQASSDAIVALTIQLQRAWSFRSGSGKTSNASGVRGALGRGAWASVIEMHPRTLPYVVFHEMESNRSNHRW